MAGLVVARLTHLDERLTTVFILITLTPWLFLPAWAVLTFALVRRRPGLACTAGVVVLSHAVWIWPDAPWERAQTASADGPTITLVTVNTGDPNDSAEELGARLLALRPDVLVVEEYSPAIRDSFERASLRSAFRWKVEDPREGAFGSAIFSRHPLIGRDRVTLSAHPTVRATLGVAGSADIELLVVHTMQPLADFDVLKRQLAELRRLAERRRDPLIFAGDFNATRHHRPFRRLLNSGMVDAHLATGRGSARTWPQGRRWIPPFALLDRVLVSDEIEVISTEEFHTPGSDHRGVVTRLQLPAAKRQGRRA